MTLGLLKKYHSKEYTENEISLVLNKILSICDPLHIYLFGSAIEAKFSDQSDLDFLIIMTTNEEIKMAKKQLVSLMPLSSHPVDIIWMTYKDFEKKKLQGGIAMIVFEDGKILYTKKDKK